METNIISFIIENIYLFLPLGIAGITITLILLFTGQKDGAEHQENLKTDNIYLVTYPINIYLLIYLFIWAMMLIMGLTSNFIIPAFIIFSSRILPQFHMKRELPIKTIPRNV